MKKKISPNTTITTIPPEIIERKIYFIRGQKVMLDRDLANLYNVKAIALRQAVKRNKNRFPCDFVIQLSREEAGALVSQNVIPSRRSLGGSLPYAFTEHGVAMLATVLNSDRAVQINILIIRAFIKLRDLLANHKHLADKLAVLERTQKQQGQTIGEILIVVDKLLKTHKELPSAIGFRV
jgi:hypothetical protein